MVLLNLNWTFWISQPCLAGLLFISLVNRLSWCNGDVFSLLCNHSLHLCESVVKARPFKLHLQVIHSAHFDSSDEAPCVSLYCHCGIWNNFFHVLALIWQMLQLALHHLLVLHKLRLYADFVLLQFQKNFSLLIDRVGQLGHFLWFFIQMTGWRWNHRIRIQSVASSVCTICASLLAICCTHWLKAARWWCLCWSTTRWQRPTLG